MLSDMTHLFWKTHKPVLYNLYTTIATSLPLSLLLNITIVQNIFHVRYIIRFEEYLYGCNMFINTMSFDVYILR